MQSGHFHSHYDAFLANETHSTWNQSRHPVHSMYRVPHGTNPGIQCTLCTESHMEPIQASSALYVLSPTWNQFRHPVHSMYRVPHGTNPGIQCTLCTESHMEPIQASSALYVPSPTIRHSAATINRFHSTRCHSSCKTKSSLLYLRKWCHMPNLKTIQNMISQIRGIKNKEGRITTVY